MVDDHSRFAYSEVLADEKGATRAVFLLRAARASTLAGIPVIERRPHRQQDELQTLHRHARRRYHPRCLALVHQAPLPLARRHVERYNRTLAAEWAYRQPFTTNTGRTAALAPWLERYNNQRRHTGQPPITRVLPTS